MTDIPQMPRKDRILQTLVFGSMFSVLAVFGCMTLWSLPALSWPLFPNDLRHHLPGFIYGHVNRPESIYVGTISGARTPRVLAHCQDGRHVILAGNGKIGYGTDADHFSIEPKFDAFSATCFYDGVAAIRFQKTSRPKYALGSESAGWGLLGYDCLIDEAGKNHFPSICRVVNRQPQPF
ncbi:hypothetical protein ACVME8_001987 [Bradyrhizobium diazoefficiens]